MPGVLVIDDEASLATIIAQFLIGAGLEVETATSGPEGLHKAASLRPDAILVDVMMPGMDGYEVCRRLRRDPRTARAVIVVLTARGQPVDRQMALQAGADIHVPKPFRGKELAQEVQQLLAGRACPAEPLGYQVLILRLKKGVGATTLATNLGVCLAEEKGCQVTLADLVGPGGGVSERLGLTTTGTWSGLSAGDAEALASSLIYHRKGLFILPAPEKGPAATEEVGWLLHTLREWNDYLLLDTPLHLGPLASVLVESSSLVLLVLTPEPDILAKAQVTIAALRRAGGGSLSVWPVLNMMTPDEQPLRQEAEGWWGCPPVAVLPWVPEEYAPASGSRPPVVLSHPDSPLAVALRALARQIVHLAGGQGETQA